MTSSYFTATPVRRLVTSECFDTYYRFAAERQQIFHARAVGEPPPWTADPILLTNKFCNVYRAADRVSQHLINEVIYRGPQDPGELIFRILLFKIFNRISTWQQLVEQLGAQPSWSDYDFGAYNRILTDLLTARRRVYSAAYLMPTPPYRESFKHTNHLRLLERIMQSDLPERLTSAVTLEQIYRLLLGVSSFGPFLAYRYAVDLNYSPAVNAMEDGFVVPGPGALDGISKCFLDTGGLEPAGLIRWMADTAPQHFDRLGLEFADLWGRSPDLVDWQGLFCETSKYTRVSHPDRAGKSGRTRIKQRFRPDPNPIEYRFPPKWGLPPAHTAQPKVGTQA